MNTIPEDIILSLVLIPNEVLDPVGDEAERERQIRLVMDADWYEVSRAGHSVLCVPAPQIEYMSEADPRDAGFSEWPLGCSITPVDDVLKRCSVEDGFYHA